MATFQHTIGYRLAHMCRAHRNYAVVMLEPYGLYPGQDLVLMQLWDEEGITQICLAERTGVDASTMTKTLQRLERRGFVERRADPDDTRATRVFLTPAGRDLETAIAAQWEQLEERTLAGFSLDERTFLRRLLRRVEDNIR